MTEFALWVNNPFNFSCFELSYLQTLCESVKELCVHKSNITRIDENLTVITVGRVFVCLHFP